MLCPSSESFLSPKKKLIRQQNVQVQVPHGAEHSLKHAGISNLLYSSKHICPPSFYYYYFLFCTVIGQWNLSHGPGLPLCWC